jgi:hypothetical protein
MGADTWVCPYGGRGGDGCGVFQNAMEMVGHDHHLVAFDIGKFAFQLEIPFFHHFSRFVQHHFPTDYFSE